MSAQTWNTTIRAKRAARYRRQATAAFWSAAAQVAAIGFLALASLAFAIAFGLALGASLSI